MSVRQMLDTCVQYRKVGIAAALATATLGTFVLAQDASSPAVVQGFPAPRLAVGQQVPAVWGVDARGRTATGYAEIREEQSKVGKALEVLRDEDASQGDRREAKESIVEVLDKQFESDLDSREKQIAELETQIDKLRAQIKKRRAAKERLIDLRVELMINEAEGLGFPSSWNSRGRFPGSSSFFSYPAAPVAPTAPAALPGLTTRPSAAATTLRGRYSEAASGQRSERGREGQSNR